MTNKIYHKSVKQAYDVIGGNTDLNPVLLQDGVFLPYRKFLRISHMVKSNYRTAAEGKHVAAATRRRRRILQAGFFFSI